jgi:Divergent InlB B-repeat domain
VGRTDGARESAGRPGLGSRSLSLLALVVSTSLVLPAVALGQGARRASASAAENAAPHRWSERVATVANAGGLVVNVTGEGIVTYSDGNSPCSMADCATNERSHQLVFLTAVPAQGYTFQGWTEGCVGEGTICGVTPAQAPVVSAEFVHAGVFQLTVSGPGVVGGDGGAISCGMGHSECSDQLSGLSTTQFTPMGSPGAVFLGWGGACAQFATDPCVVANSAVSGATAAFGSATPPSSPQSLTVTHTLAVASAPEALDACLAAQSCATSVPGGSFYTLTAGGSFINNPFSVPLGVSWTGGCVGSWPVCSLIVEGPTAITVHTRGFEPDATEVRGPAPVTLTVMVVGRGRLRAVRGTLSPRGCGARAVGGGYSCTLSETAGAFDLRAQPVGRNRFRRWDSSLYPVCRPATRVDCSARVSYEGPDMAANFSGG